MPCLPTGSLFEDGNNGCDRFGSSTAMSRAEETRRPSKALDWILDAPVFKPEWSKELARVPLDHSTYRNSFWQNNAWQ